MKFSIHMIYDYLYIFHNTNYNVRLLTDLVIYLLVRNKIIYIIYIHIQLIGYDILVN